MCRPPPHLCTILPAIDVAARRARAHTSLASIRALAGLCFHAACSNAHDAHAPRNASPPPIDYPTGRWEVHGAETNPGPPRISHA
eukprot:scaffold2264_cov114-Isochrysis_galbana.AAC.4